MNVPNVTKEDDDQMSDEKQIEEGTASRPHIDVDEADAPTGRDSLRLIAHRGGVTEGHAENSPGALAQAIAEGYWMVETDLRESADREIVVHHDPTLSRIGRPDLAVGGARYSELEAAYARAGAEPPMRFAELCTRARGRIELILDFKPGPRSGDFLQRVEDQLAANGFGEQTMVIGTDRAKAHLPVSIGANIRVPTDAWRRTVTELSVRAVDLNPERVTPEEVAELAARGIQVLANLADSPVWWRRINEWPFGALKTNFPEEYTEWWYREYMRG